MQSNPLTTLLEQYNSDSENEDSKPQAKQLDDKVNDFFKVSQICDLFIGYASSSKIKACPRFFLYNKLEKKNSFINF